MTNTGSGLYHVIGARVAKLVDASDLKSEARKGVRVQVPPCAPPYSGEIRRVIKKEMGLPHWIFRQWGIFPCLGANTDLSRKMEARGGVEPPYKALQASA